MTPFNFLLYINFIFSYFSEMFCYEIEKTSRKSIRDLCILFNTKEENTLKLKFFVEKEMSFAFITEICSVKS
jgi:hypothetical protein